MLASLCRTLLKISVFEAAKIEAIVKIVYILELGLGAEAESLVTAAVSKFPDR
eukprot:SAG31_NODE_130_length_23424_cov_45.648802_9_plen_53_part_00